MASSPTSKNTVTKWEARVKDGRAHRDLVSRKQLAQVHSQGRTFYPIEQFIRCQAGRLPDLLPLKYSRMAASPFAFFRGSVDIMAADLAQEPNTGIHVQLCGDAHLQNLGAFAGPDGGPVFDLNDFDETIPGPWEWDVKRMAVSIVLAGHESNHGRATCARAVAAFVKSYCSQIAKLAAEPLLSGVRHQVHRMPKSTAVAAAFKQAERSMPCDLLAKYTVPASTGGAIFKRLPDVQWRVNGAEKTELLAALAGYRAGLAPERRHWFDFFQPKDVCFRVVGTGSVGLRNYVVLLTGNQPNDALFLQIKQATESAYSPYLQLKFPHQGQRVINGQRAVQPLSDLLLGSTTIGKADFIVRQLNDRKGSVNLQQLKGDGLEALASIAGELIARGHARSGDVLQLKGYIGGQDKVIQPLVDFALEYAAQVDLDFEQFQKAIREGQIPVAPPIAQNKKPNRNAPESSFRSVKATA